MTTRSVFFISDGTGITAETFGNSILAQFAVKARPCAQSPSSTPATRRIRSCAKSTRRRIAKAAKPIVFTTLVNHEVLEIVTKHSRGLVLDMIRTFVEPLEHEFGVKSNHRVGRFPDIAKSQEYTERIEAINYSLAHDDGQSARNLESADVIPRRRPAAAARRPTSLYLAMQHGIKAANYPLIPEDFERGQPPPAVLQYKRKCFGLTIDPERLSHIRNERRPGSKYAALANCRYEVHEAELMMRRQGIAWLSSTHKSIEEIATTILRDIKPDRLVY